MTDYGRDAEALARYAHRNDLDKLGNPYVDHLYRVVHEAQKKELGPYGVAVAWLHDIIEDHPYVYEVLYEEFPLEVLSPLEELTRDQGERYQSYIERVARSEWPLARQVKILDLKDHLNQSGNFYRRESLMERYRKALDVLEPPPAQPIGSFSFWDEDVTSRVGWPGILVRSDNHGR